MGEQEVAHGESAEQPDIISRSENHSYCWDAPRLRSLPYPTCKYLRRPLTTPLQSRDILCPPRGPTLMGRPAPARLDRASYLWESCLVTAWPDQVSSLNLSLAEWGRPGGKRCSRNGRIK
ncbi:hypothetical protein NL676_019393 [Syzygium grande]|nr:hypothetical protein NL676_019393 [Syzygium grande]